MFDKSAFLKIKWQNSCFRNYKEHTQQNNRETTQHKYNKTPIKPPSSNPSPLPPPFRILPPPPLSPNPPSQHKKRRAISPQQTRVGSRTCDTGCNLNMFTGSTLGLTNTCPLSKYQWLGLFVGVSFPKTCPVADPLAKLLLSNLDTTGVLSLWAEWSWTQTLLSNWGNKWGRYTQRSDKNVKPPC